jgi:uncharacterized membrane protein HdeD (DUF308 family)
MMSLSLAQNWWALALRGLAAVIFGLLLFVWPFISLAVLVLLFGAYAMADGLFSIVATATVSANSSRWWSLLIGGVLSFIVGLMTFIWPGITALALLYLMALRALVIGVIEIVAANRLRREISGGWVLALSGIISILFGLMMLISPAAGALVVIWFIGFYAFVTGATLLVLALRLRRWTRVSDQTVLGAV